MIARVRNVQRKWRRHKFYKLIHTLLAKRRRESVAVLQRYLRSYLARKHYGLTMHHNLVNKKLDNFIDGYADYRKYILETLQIHLAYRARRMIKRNRLEREAREKRA